MNNKRLGKLFLLLVLLTALCCLLTGCIKDPNTNNSSSPTWKTYTTQPSINPETPVVYTPTPDPGQQSWGEQPIWGNTATPTVGIATPYVPATATPSPTPIATPTSSMLRLGSQGEAVANVQAALKRLGYFEGKTDGDFGEYTENAVKNFQAQNGLTADGIVGPSTLSKLSSSSAKTARPTSTPTPKATNTPKPTAVPSYNNTYLENGSKGTKVTQMQSRLISLGYLAGSASGSFCDITEMAVISFQTRSGLDADGVAGPGTLKKLYSTSARKASSAVGVIGVSLKRGDENSDAVRLLQNKLKSYGFYSGNVDGDYGEGTEAAVKAFQRANGLTADGKAGSSTLNKLFAGSVSTSSGSVSNNNTSKATATPRKTPTPTPKKAATPTPNAYVRVTERPDGEYFTLEKGMMGEPVKKLQRALRSAGYFKGTVDGYYGDDTVEAVKKYQEYRGLKKDGKAGPATLRYLYEGAFPKGS